jgi:hypothetical protein
LPTLDKRKNVMFADGITADNLKKYVEVAIRLNESMSESATSY